MKKILTKKLKKTSAIQCVVFFSVLLTTLACAISAVSYFSAKAAALGTVYTTDDGLWLYTWDENNSSIPTLVGYNGTDTNITLPSKTYQHYDQGQYYDTYVKFTVVDVSSYNSNFFRNMDKTQVQSVTIPNNYTKIGSDVFSGCTSLTSVTLPDTITSIGDKAFYGCTSLTSVTLPNTITSIGNYVFSGCSSLTSINLPQSVTSMGESVFAYTGFETFTWPSHIQSIPVKTFEGSNLRSINISYGTKQISSKAFDECRSLQNVVFPQSLTHINYGVFYNCTSLAKVVLPSSITYLDTNIFQNCSGLTAVTFPKGYNKIPENTFNGCTSLRTVTGTENVTRISYYAFYNCTSLESLDMPNLNSLGGYAFSGVNAECFKSVFDNLTNIESYAFGGITFENPFTVPAGVTNLDYYTFENATMPKLIIPSTVTSVSSYACQKSNIDEIEWNARCSSIPYCFCRWSKVKKVTVNQSLNSIGSYAFYECESLEEFNAYAVTGSIGSYAFFKCSLLTDISPMLQFVTGIEAHAFAECESLGKVVLGGSLTALGEEAFCNSGITELDAGACEETVYRGDNVFKNCTELTKVYWNISLVSKAYLWGYKTFYGCTALTDFTFGPYCSNLNESANFFNGCSSLKNVYIYTDGDSSMRINSSFMYNAASADNPATIYYYADTNTASVLETYYSKYNSSDGYHFEIATIDSDKTFTNCSLSSSSMSIKIGETANLPTGTITYSDNSTAQTNSDNSYWSVSGMTGKLLVDTNERTVKGLSLGTYTINLVLIPNENHPLPLNEKYYLPLTVTVTNEEGGSDVPTITGVNFTHFYVDDVDIASSTRNYEAGTTPFGYDKGNDGASIYATIGISPANSTENFSVKITQGVEILKWDGWESVGTGTTRNYKLNFIHQTAGGNYNYGTVTVKVTVGECEAEYTFDLRKYDNAGQELTGVYFNDASQAKQNLVVGESYTYAAFPTVWYGSQPYDWYEVKYELSNSKIADISVEHKQDEVADNYNAYVANVTPKKAGQVILYAYPAGLRGWYQKITINITDPNGSTNPTQRPDESPNEGEIWATSISLPKSKTIWLDDAETYTVTPTIQPANCNDELTYYSYDPDIAAINPDTGAVTAKKAGTTTIGVSTSSGLNATMKLIVVSDEVKTESMTVPASLIMCEGDTVTLTITRTPANTTDDIIITSDNEDAVKIVDGRLTAVAAGTATVTVTSGDITKTCAVTVSKAATGITLDQTSAELKRGNTLQLTAALQPEGVVGNIKWTSSNTKIATVSADGKVTAVGYGDVEITATVNSKYSAVCKIFVAPNIDFKILGASIRVSDPYGIRFGIQLGKTGDYGKVEIVEYGTIMLPTEKLGGAELLLSTADVLRVQGKVIYSETSSARVYTGVLINIPNSFFDTEVSGRGYLVYKDTNGAQRTIYTDTVSRSFHGVAEAAYESYSQIEKPTSAQKAVIDKLKKILGL